MMFVVTQFDVTSVMESHTPGSDVRTVSDDTFHYFDWKYKVGRNKFFGNTIHPISVVDSQQMHMNYLTLCKKIS